MAAGFKAYYPSVGVGVVFVVFLGEGGLWGFVVGVIVFFIGGSLLHIVCFCLKGFAWIKSRLAMSGSCILFIFTFVKRKSRQSVMCLERDAAVLQNLNQTECVNLFWIALLLWLLAFTRGRQPRSLARNSENLYLPK